MWLKSTIVRTNEQNKRTITRGQGRRREAGSEGRLWETCELMDKKCIQGRRRLVSWLHTAKSFGSSTQVNATVVQGSIVFLPGEVSMEGETWLQSAVHCFAPRAVMPVVSFEKSAESIVVVSESVSNRHPLGVGEECGKSVRSKARTRSMNSNHMCPKRRVEAERPTSAGWLHDGKHVSSTSSLRVCSG